MMVHNYMLNIRPMHSSKRPMYSSIRPSFQRFTDQPAGIALLLSECTQSASAYHVNGPVDAAKRWPPASGLVSATTCARATSRTLAIAADNKSLPPLPNAKNELHRVAYSVVDGWGGGGHG
jgi:hypothetical protein